MAYKDYEFVTENGKSVAVHRMLMAKIVGRKLAHYEHVHHINFNKKDNRPENLQLMHRKEHWRLHFARNPTSRICPECKNVFEPKAHRKIAKFCSRSCASKNTRRNEPLPRACRNGHPRTEENTYISKTGQRSCRVCGRENHQKCYRRMAFVPKEQP